MTAMTLDDSSSLLKVLVGLTAPPILTVLCWLVGRNMAGSRREGTRGRDEEGFWPMLIAAYLIFALALVGGHYFAGKDDVDPTSRMVQ
jgi:hypothetical protein